MVRIAVELHAVVKLLELAVDTDVYVTLLAQILEQVLVMSLAVLDQRGEDVYLTAFVIADNEVDDLIAGILHHRFARDIAAGLPHSGEKQTEEVVNLGGGADGAPRILVDGLLLDAYHWAESGDLVDVGTFERAEHIAGIRRESLDVSSLPLGEYGVECERRLAAAAEAGDHVERVVRQSHINVLEIVDPGAVHLDGVGRHDRHLGHVAFCLYIGFCHM